MCLSLLPPPCMAGKDSAPVAFAGFAALLAPVAPPPFVGLGADRRPTASAAAMCALITIAAMQSFLLEKGHVFIRVKVMCRITHLKHSQSTQE